MKHFQQNHAVAVNPLIYIVCYLNIYLVCYLSNLSQRRYIYSIYLNPQGFHAPILCTLISYASGLSPGMSKVKMLFWKHPLTHVLTPTPTPRLRSTRRLSTFCHHLPTQEKHARKHYWTHNLFPAEFFYDHIRPASGPRLRRWRLKCSKQCSAVTCPPCHPSCDTQQKINVQLSDDDVDCLRNQSSMNSFQVMCSNML